MLNNQLTDFAAIPSTAGSPVANRVQPGRAPAQLMAPTLVFDLKTEAPPATSRWPRARRAAAPSSGTTKTLVGALDWGLDAQQATSMVDFGAANSPTTNVGGEHPNINTANGGNDDPLVSGLRALGHVVSISAQSSGIGTILRVQRNGQAQLKVGLIRAVKGLFWALPFR